MVDDGVFVCFVLLVFGAIGGVDVNVDVNVDVEDVV